MPSSLSHSRSKRGGPVSIAFPAHTRLFDPERPSRSLYVLRSGCVQLAKAREVIVDYLLPGDVFGEKCLLTRHRDTQTATTLTPVRILVFRRSELPDVLQGNPRLAGKLLKNLAFRLDRYEEALRDFVVERTERRLARLLFRFLPPRAGSGWVCLRFSPSTARVVIENRRPLEKSSRMRRLRKPEALAVEVMAKLMG